MGRKRATLMGTQEKVAVALSGDNVKLTFTARRPMADVVNKHIMLPPVPDEVTPDVETKVRAWTDHESAHIRFSSKPWELDLVKDKVLKNLAFALEDCRVDRMNGERYPGTLDNRRRMFDIVRPELDCGNVLQAAIWALYEVTKGYFAIAPSAAYWGERLGEANGERVIAYMLTLVEDQIRRVRVAPDQEEVISICREIKEIWHDLFKNGTQPQDGDGEGESKMNDGGMFGGKKDEEEQQEKSQKSKPQKGDGESEGEESEDEQGEGGESDDGLDDVPDDYEESDEGESDGEGDEPDDEAGEDGEESDEGDEDESESDEDGESEDESESDGADGESDENDESDGNADEDESSGGEQGKDKPEKSDKEVDDEMDSMMDDFDPMSDVESKELEKDLEYDPEEIEEPEYDDDGNPILKPGYMAWTENDITKDLEPRSHGTMAYEDTGCRMVTPEEFRALVRSKVGTLQRRLLRDLQSRRRMWVKDRTRGTVDDTRLDRVGTGDGRVFKRKLRRPDIDLAVTMLLDLSHSMHGKQEYLCAQLGYVMAETLGALNVPFEALGFTTGFGMHTCPPEDVYYHRRSQLIQVVIKPFSLTRRADVLKQFYTVAQYSGAGTIEGEPLLWAAKRIAERPESRKVIITICDGEPCGGSYGLDAHPAKFKEHVASAVKRVNAAGIETIGVGILTDAVKDYYPRWVVYSGLDDLLTGFYGQFGALLRGEKRRTEDPVPTT